MKLLITTLILLINYYSFSQRILGEVTDANNRAVPYASIIVEGTLIGASANSLGIYSLDLQAGTYNIICKHINFKSSIRKITISDSDVVVDFKLVEQQYELPAIMIKNGKDQSYEIIKNAIDRRLVYESELKTFTAEVYIKGQLQLQDYPKKFLGKKVDFGDGDASKNKIIFLSETVAKYAVDEPKRKVEVLSTKVSGFSDGFGFSSPQIISFYQNNVSFGATINPRGFISPISDRAFNYYNFKFQGSFFDNGVMVNRIKVSPKRNYEPLFNGYINIIENEWRIHSLKLSVFKENQAQLVDTLIIEQLYVPVSNVWVIKQQVIYPSIKLMGFDASGGFVQVYDKFDFDPKFAKGYFDNTILSFEDSANKKGVAYWDSIRPVPLLPQEVRDFKVKDSLEQLRTSKPYIDSVDRINNKLNPLGLLISGQRFVNTSNKSSTTIKGLIEIFSYNTVEGLSINFKPVYEKKFANSGRKAIIIFPGIRYGVSNKRLNPNLGVQYRFESVYPASIAISGGRDVFQFNNANPVRVFWNSLRTLGDEINFLKIYEAGFARVDFSKGVGYGLTLSGSFEHQNRMGLNNTTDHAWKNFPDREFEPNISLVSHKASNVSFNVQWQPGAQYIAFPDRKVNIGSHFPTLNLGFTQGINGLLGSTIDYTKWTAGIDDDINLKIAGRLLYRITAGGFLNAKNVFLPDYKHFTGNLGNVAAPYVNSFQLLPFYAYSNIEKLYTTAHLEYHLNGLLTNKIPLFKKLNWFLVGGSNVLLLKNRSSYSEVFVGLENILRLGRIDFVRSFTQKGFGWQTSGIRYSFALLKR